MFRLSLLAFMSLWFSAASLAQEDAPPLSSTAAEALEQCLAQDDIETCTGAWVAPCSEDALTTVDILACYAPELAFWETRLSTALVELEQIYVELDQFDDATRALAPRLEIYQEQWEAWRAAKCGFEYDKFRGGSLGRITHVDCQLTETSTRVAELRALLEEAGL
ncbi:MAG: DUF1311 domain-containing protein [Alphaproteobacteria bacterium]|nr:DUF1311 domain-containing protein [Alphaproteobacteria bacterium]